MEREDCGGCPSSSWWWWWRWWWRCCIPKTVVAGLSLSTSMPRSFKLLQLQRNDDLHLASPPISREMVVPRLRLRSCWRIITDAPAPVHGHHSRPRSVTIHHRRRSTTKSFERLTIDDAMRERPAATKTFWIQRDRKIPKIKDTKTFWHPKIRKPFGPKDTKTFWTLHLHRLRPQTTDHGHNNMMTVVTTTPPSSPLLVASPPQQ